MSQIISRHDVFLVDNYGVLKTASGPIAGTNKIIRAIQDQGKRAILLSNTASESPRHIQQDLETKGVYLEEKDIVTSGMVLKPYFSQHGLVGKRIFNLGNDGGAEYIRNAGGSVLSREAVLADKKLAEVVVVTRHKLTAESANLIPAALIEAAINILRYGPEVQGIIANPDKTVPLNNAEVRLGPGSMGLIVEACSERLLVWLGKPHRPIYDFAFSLVPDVPKERILMVDDSLEYGIQGACNAGIQSLLVLTGNTTNQEQIKRSPFKPNYVAGSFTLDAKVNAWS
ncbi:hypothetical protein A2276_06920 [candidate division WOR-1 bacterium RIFOXYA12_FULL_43_27]|uniref:Haloacid dehalogenase n=1 Tax=candidate division WOR-1 bacterium RIFOXYC2_FULL_46_14 TaxID=1802587 RepID=A0A1F4U5J0_UNCSA|nr:MAG: hypothetical protein A2276_06920 [candidate division WOR-1 bacterium RIFOXYA12_FULL_43_27]OGC20378.1 MAG: hypothetical protein A2292_04920 [candidate division WOR-1 bacterium RIFOXYB2_FULL_46_45]OGC31885.1 MAG: hypothetical protein A2232_06530 [candidate division WOR-1 bacterium RIFOXYA2_FULL_46_56]OGC40224.1 MAG: hypothetical protein A2438_02940 [candidate division WOR-1 bacterium RIFOXYC2_FULL_46_14]